MFDRARSTVCGPIAGTKSDLIANLGDRVFFDFNATNLTTNDRATLNRQVAWLMKYPGVDILIAGNADDRGTETYNLALGQRRAGTVRDYMLVHGISASRINTVSYGKDCPVASGNTAEAYDVNRNAITSVQGFNPQNCCGVN
jgi:peptidoglycan-associated lipoprotein